MAGLFNEIQTFTEQNQGNAACSFCHQHAREKLVELPDGTREMRRARVFRTNLHIHMEGWVEVCEWCLLEGAKAIGLATKTDVAKFHRQLNEAHEHEEFLRSELEEARRTVRSLSAELARHEDEAAPKYEAAWKRGYDQAEADAKVELADAAS